MHCYSIALALQTLASLLIIQGVLSSIDYKQNGCYKSSVMLDCPRYKEPSHGSRSMDLKWRFRDVSTGTWERLARIKRGKQRQFPVNTNLQGRFTVHSNGSLEIRSLHPDDETLYLCIVMQHGDREAHLIELNVACGQVTVMKREVCVEDDVMLECAAKHRTNPRKLERVTWKKKTDSDRGSSYSKVAALKDNSGAEADDGFYVHGNGSLTLRKGRDESDDVYKCDVSKSDGSRADTHFVRVKNIKCQKETQGPGLTKANMAMGRISMTTMKPGIVMATDSKPTSTTQDTIRCGGVLNNPVGTFQSPNFPSPYPANSHCKWTISVPQGYAAINISLDYLNLEPEKICRYDYLIVYDKLGNQVECRHCGYYKRPVQFQVKGRIAVVEFRSDGSVEKTGFKASYKAV